MLSKPYLGVSNLRCHPRNTLLIWMVTWTEGTIIQSELPESSPEWGQVSQETPGSRQAAFLAGNEGSSAPCQVLRESHSLSGRASHSFPFIAEGIAEYEHCKI